MNGHEKSDTNPRGAGRPRKYAGALPSSALPELAAASSTVSVDARAAARHILRLRDASDSFAGFVCLHNQTHGMPDDPTKYPKFQRELMKVLDDVETGRRKRVLITVPPRAGKSTFGTQLFPAYYLAKDPRRFVMSASYNQELATDFGRRVRSYVRDPLTLQAFPTFKMADDSQSVVRWNTTVGGQYVAIGYFGTATGRGANLLIIDDPIKNRAEADSIVLRNKVWSDYTNSFQRRVETGKDGEPGSIIIILTRWHPDDLAGRLMNSRFWAAEGWYHFNVQGITAPSTDITISRTDLPKDHPEYRPNEWCQKHPGQRYIPLPAELRATEERSFWQERDEFSLSTLRLLRDEDPRAFASLYQQTPYVQGGNLIKDEWWQFYQPTTGLGLPEGVEPQVVIIAWDTAFSTSTTADYSVAVVAALATNGNIYILDVRRRRVDFPTLKQMAIGINGQYRGRGLIGHYVEDRASGQSLIQEMRKESGMSVIGIRPIADKVTRVQSVLGLIQGGRVFLPEDAPWLDDFLDEFRTFPKGDHDDQVDATAMGLDVLSKHTLRVNDLFSGPLTSAAHPTSSLQPRQSPATFLGWGE